MERPRDADIEEPDCVAAAIGGPSSSDRARMSGWTSRWGLGPLGDAQDDQETFDPGRRCAPAFARGCGRRHAPDGALACRPQQARPRPVLGRSHVG
jgi:hypothetical protein